MVNIQRKLKFYFSYWLFWLVYFVVARCVFLLFNWSKTKAVESFSEVISIFSYGAKLDLSTTGYLLLLPTLLLILNSFLKRNIAQKPLLIYTSILLFALSFLAILDASLYGHWGNKLDIYGMVYVNNLGEVLNFIPLKTLVINTLSFFTLFLASYFFYQKKIHPLLKEHEKNYTVLPLTFLLLAGLSILPIRGGVGMNPLNLSNVYFSNNAYANHSAINILWNVAYTFSEREKLYQSFKYISAPKVEPLFKSLYPQESPAPNILKSKTPNIVFLILESFTSKLIDKKWNGVEITPHLNQLTKEGIYFSNFYASGDRTDEGLVSILSGFPAQPLSYIINYQNKTAKLPSLVQDLKKMNYVTSFYYGGDINFANMKSYLLQSGVEKIVAKEYFPSEQFNAKWGVHDHFVFEKLLSDIQVSEQPFFKILLSLSSHPPFDTPIPTVIEGTDDNSLFANSANYTDQAIGDFISKLKTTEAWENTLVVLVADHGITYLDNRGAAAPEKYKIPMIWLGGAVATEPQNITKIASQTDIVNTLLSQLNQGSQHFEYSKNILSPTSESFCFYTFNHGFGFLADSTQMIYTYKGKRYIKNENTAFPDSIGQAYLQKVSNDFSKN